MTDISLGCDNTCILGWRLLIHVRVLQAGHETVDIALPFVRPRVARVEAIDNDTGEPVDLGLTSRFLDALQKLGLMQTMGCLRLQRREVRQWSRI